MCSICGDCHTPRSSIGVPNRFDVVWRVRARTLVPLGELVPNITPARTKRLGSARAKREEIADLLLTGTKPDLDYVRGLMYDAIQGTSTGTAT